MHVKQGHAQALAETARAMLRMGKRPVLVWFPLDAEQGLFAAYLCEHVDGELETYRVVTMLGEPTGQDVDFSKDGLAWAALEAGAGFRRFTRRAGADGQACIVLPNGTDVIVS